MKLLPLGFEVEWLVKLQPVQLPQLLVFLPTASSGPPLEAYGLDLYKWVTPVKAVPLIMHVVGHQGRPSLRPFRRGHKYPLHRFSRPLAKKLVVERVDRVLVFPLFRTLAYRVLLRTGAADLLPPRRVLVRTGIARRVTLFDLYRQKVRRELDERHDD